MSQVNRHWRTATTVMVAARTNRRVNRAVCKPPKTNTTECTTRVTSSTASPQLSKQTDGYEHGFNYNVLMLKRSGNSRFMPSAHVFPGGKISEADYSHEWLQVFKDAGQQDVVKTLTAATTSLGKLPPVFQQESETAVANVLALRICAIRETFEESGVFICKNPSGEPATGHGFHDVHLEKLKCWRDVVHKDGSKFVELCKAFGVVPDVWSLHSWSDWLTPSNMHSMHGGRRFDTVFFMCCLPETRELVHDEKEIVSSQWHSPVSILQEFHAAQSWLAPPQVYELSRLCQFQDIAELAHFAELRERQGSARWLPVRMNCTDGLVSILPGDELYPMEPDLEGKHPAPELGQSYDDSLKSTEHHHRMELREPYTCSIHCNVPQTHGHVTPMLMEEFQQKFGNNPE